MKMRLWYLSYLDMTYICVHGIKEYIMWSILNGKYRHGQPNPESHSTTMRVRNRQPMSVD